MLSNRTAGMCIPDGKPATQEGKGRARSPLPRRRMTCPRPGLNGGTPPAVWQRNIQPTAHTGFHLLSGGRLFTHGINPQPTVGMRKSARASLLPSISAVDSVALGPACTPAAGGRSGIERRPRGHMKESFKDSSHRTIEGRLPFLYIPSCFFIGLWVFFSLRPGVWRHFLSAVPALPLCVYFLSLSPLLSAKSKEVELQAYAVL